MINNFDADAMPQTQFNDNNTNSLKQLYIKTYGCQMNVYDSEKMAALLKPHGFSITEDFAAADMAILNTCHIREKAAEKVYSDVGRLAIHKNRKKQEGADMIIVVAGCLAQAEGEEVVRRAPDVDIVVGPQSYHNIPILLEEIRRTKSWAINLDFDENTKFDYIQDNDAKLSAFLSIQEGCDKFCHFCVVPYTRGAEISRPFSDVYREALMLASNGAREITLLGQNVSGYRGKNDLSSDGNSSIGDLISAIAKIEDVKRIRYTTSHPMDMVEGNEALFRAHAEEVKLMPYLHLPIQSGSDKILRAMNRKHSAEEYVEVIQKFRAARPDIAISSDFIVGYPGETNEDFENTMSLVKQVKYASAFSFMYSPRPGTPAYALSDQIPEEEKKYRLQKLQSLLKMQQLEFNSNYIGQIVESLVERSGKNPGQMVGKSPHWQSVVCDGDESMLGRIVKVRIKHVTQSSLIGDVVE